MATSKKATPAKALKSKTAPKPKPVAKVAKTKSVVASEPKGKMPQATFNIDEIKALLQAVQDSNINELKLEKGDFKVNIRHGAATVQVAQQAPVYQAMPSAPAPAPAPSAAPAAPKAEAPAPSADNLITIKSPMIGTFYRSAGPGKPTFVNVGDDIKAGQVLCIIEAMKLFNEIESEMSGTIVKVLVEDGTSVEYDQPLFLVQP
jgi:acetyl-CoA carboxylase biotin carboxyl carrier protein